MSRENVEIVRRTVDAYAAGDDAIALAAYADDVEFDVSLARPEGGVFHGPQGIREAILAWINTWAEYSFEVEEILDSGDHVLMVVHESGRGVGSGAPIDQRVYWLQELRGGQIIRCKLYIDRDQAFAAAGLAR